MRSRAKRGITQKSFVVCCFGSDAYVGTVSTYSGWPHLCGDATRLDFSRADRGFAMISRDWRMSKTVRRSGGWHHWCGLRSGSGRCFRRCAGECEAGILGRDQIAMRPMPRKSRRRRQTQGVWRKIQGQWQQTKVGPAIQWRVLPTCNRRGAARNRRPAPGADPCRTVQ